MPLGYEGRIDSSISIAKEKRGGRVLVQRDGATNNRLLVLCCGRLLVPLGWEGSIDHLISIANEKEGGCVLVQIDEATNNRLLMPLGWEVVDAFRVGWKH
ncbi:hypothetical protein [Bartonella sp. CL100XZDX]|uniref:hypothetical protein n=1 Tax=Bartonella sp. CL100XZDX TaxID=3243515 RepID=UPI0035D10B86